MSPSQVVALTSVITSGLVGVAGVSVGFLNGRSDRKNVRELAREERRQHRLADAYIDLLQLAEQVGAWVALLRPIVDTIPPKPGPPLPSLEDQHRVEAKIGAFGSGQVKDAMEAWWTTVQAILKADQTIELRQQYADSMRNTGEMRGDQEARDFRTPWGELDEVLRPAERVTRAAMTSAVAAELQS